MAGKRGRRPKPGKANARRSRPGRPAAAPLTPTDVFEAVLAEATGVASTPDPLSIEVLVSGILDLFTVPIPDWTDLAEDPALAFVAFLEATRTADALAVLRGIEAIDDGQLAIEAAASAQRLRFAGIPEPMAKRAMGPRRFVGGWTAIDEFGDQEMVAAAFAPRDPAASSDGSTGVVLAFMIDHNFEGLVRESMLADNVESLRSTWADISGMQITDLDAQGVADRLGQGLRMYRLYQDPPVSDDVHELSRFMQARLRDLPSPRSLEVREVPESERIALLSDFLGSPEAQGSPLADLARWFIDYRCDFTDGDPLRWSPIAVEICLLDWFPRRAALKEPSLRAVPDVLHRFVRYAGRRKGLSGDAIEETLTAIDTFEPQYLDAMADDGAAGPATSLVDSMRRDGVDLASQPAIDAWIAAFNDRPFEERDRILG